MNSKLVVAIGILTIVAAAPAGLASPLLHLPPTHSPSLIERTGSGESVRSWFDWLNGGLGDSPVEKPAMRKPARQKRVARKQVKITCDAAARIIAGYAFSEVTPVSCSGASYVFQAKREEKAFSVTLSARNGDLIKVKRAVVTASR
jgi:hypothetical protein